MEQVIPDHDCTSAGGDRVASPVGTRGAGGRGCQALGRALALALGAGGSQAPQGLCPLTPLHLAAPPQVECNSKLDPTTTTFLKVRPSSPPWARPQGEACLASWQGRYIWSAEPVQVCGGQARLGGVLLRSLPSLPADGGFRGAPAGHTGETALPLASAGAGDLLPPPVLDGQACACPPAAREAD